MRQKKLQETCMQLIFSVKRSTGDSQKNKTFFSTSLRQPYLSGVCAHARRVPLPISAAPVPFTVESETVRCRGAGRHLGTLRARRLHRIAEVTLL